MACPYGEFYPHSMSNLPPLHKPPSTNGHAKGYTNGANPRERAPRRRAAAETKRKPAPAPRTEFPAPLSATASPRTWLYHLSRQQLGGAPMLRWVVVPLGLLAIVWGAGWLPGRWWGLGLSLLALGALLIAVRRGRRRDFVRFTSGPFTQAGADHTSKAPLDASDKLPIYATGHFTVEEKAGRFTALPGFYRTFATREHALLCRLGEPNFLGVGRWPAEDFGMWYIFLAPDDIARVETGYLHFDGQPRATLAVQRRVDVPKRGWRSGTRSVLQTVYITPCNEADLAPLLADLLHDRPPAQASEAAFDFAPAESSPAAQR